MTATKPIPTSRVREPVRPRRRWGLRIFVTLLVAVLLTPLVTAGYVVLVSRQDDRTPTDALLVLGAAQYWSRPSPVLEARLAHAKTLYDAGVASRIITVGGKQPGDRTTEAQAGQAWLTAEGVPADAVSAVPTGSDTLASLQAVAVLMREHRWTSLTIVTDPAHEARSLSMARALGIDARPSPTREGAGSLLTFDYVSRESAALLLFWVRDRRDVDQVVSPA
ncbi:MAG TPA: YdcF family protein [Candidatus Nanopelagicales bacterium]